jgi:pimeloyl-ACP methyl ester carboxylesterase
VTPNADPDYALLDRLGAAMMMFHPRPDFQDAPEGASDGLIEVAPGVAVAARFYVYDVSYPTILYFHGNGEIASDHDGFAYLYGESRTNLFVAEFRGYGRSNGTPSVEHLVSDAHPIAREFHALLDRVGFTGGRFIMGRSLGSHPALELAANAPGRFDGLIIESGASGLRRMVERYGLDAEQGPAADLVRAHEAKIRSIQLPLLIIHGERDDLVPLETATELYGMLEHVEREMLVIPKAGHNDLLWLGWQQYFAAIKAFVERWDRASAR